MCIRDRPTAATWHFCCEVVASITVPLMLLLPDRDEATRVKALQLGADDCMARPVQLLELVARVRALLRRSRRRAAARKAARYVDGELTIDLAAGRVALNGKRVALTPAELRVLACLVDNAGRVVAVEQLCQVAREAGEPAPAAAIRRCIGRIRQKVEADPRHPHRVVTRRGEGYALIRAAGPAA